mgnify:CR=1 FL=1
MENLTLILQIVAYVLSSLAIVIPLVVNLVKYVKKAVQEKNWNTLVKLILGYIKEAETNYATGADKKEWVMSMAKQTAKEIGFELDEETLSNLIDSIVEMSKKVNIK